MPFAPPVSVPLHPEPGHSHEQLLSPGSAVALAAATLPASPSRLTAGLGLRLGPPKHARKDHLRVLILMRCHVEVLNVGLQQLQIRRIRQLQLAHLRLECQLAIARALSALGSGFPISQMVRSAAQCVRSAWSSSLSLVSQVLISGTSVS